MMLNTASLLTFDHSPNPLQQTLSIYKLLWSWVDVHINHDIDKEEILEHFTFIDLLLLPHQFIFHQIIKY